MPLRNTPQRWGAVSQALHWTTVLLVLALVPLGLLAANWPLSPTKLTLFEWHKSLGLLAGTLAVLRILWRLTGPAPSHPPAAPAWERRAAAASHTLLYGLLLALPLSGWVINSAANIPFDVFGLFPLPNITASDKGLQTVAENLHLGLVITLGLAVTLHVAAALRHHRRGHDVLRRMLPAGGGTAAR
jgi:cytochrome b561